MLIKTDTVVNTNTLLHTLHVVVLSIHPVSLIQVANKCQFLSVYNSLYTLKATYSSQIKNCFTPYTSCNCLRFALWTLCLQCTYNKYTYVYGHKLV